MDEVFEPERNVLHAIEELTTALLLMLDGYYGYEMKEHVHKAIKLLKEVVENA